MTARICPVPGCGAPVKRGRAMCRSCWGTAGQDHKRNVGRSWRAFQRAQLDDKIPALNLYRYALDLAIADVVARR